VCYRVGRVPYPRRASYKPLEERLRQLHTELARVETGSPASESETLQLMKSCVKPVRLISAVPHLRSQESSESSICRSGLAAKHPSPVLFRTLEFRPASL